MAHWTTGTDHLIEKEPDRPLSAVHSSLCPGCSVVTPPWIGVHAETPATIPATRRHRSGLGQAHLKNPPPLVRELRLSIVMAPTSPTLIITRTWMNTRAQVLSATYKDVNVVPAARGGASH